MERIENLNAKMVKLFHLEEFENFGLVILQVVILINLWFFNNNKYYILGNEYFQTACHPFLQWCKPFQSFFLLNFASDYRSFFFSFILFLLTISFVALIKKKYGLSVLITFVITCLTVFPVYIFTNGYGDLIHHQDVYLFYVLLIFFFARHNRFQLLTVFFFLTYFLSSIPKFSSEFWTLGLLPTILLDSTTMPIGTNIIVLSQLILPYFLIFGTRNQRILSVIFFELFHFYSVAITGVAYSFFWITIPFIYLLFYEYYEQPTLKTFKNNLWANIVLLIFVFMSVVRLIIPGSDAVTKEGSSYALNMYNTSYYTKVAYQDDQLKMQTKSESFLDGYYAFVNDLQKNCIDSRPRSIKVNVYSVYNTYAIIDEPNYCGLTYNPWWHNDWIGRNIKYNEDLTKLSATQIFFYGIESKLEYVYFSIFIFMSFLIISSFLQKEEHEKR